MSHALALIEHNAPATDRFASCLAALWLAPRVTEDEIVRARVMALPRYKDDDIPMVRDIIAIGSFFLLRDDLLRALGVLDVAEKEGTRAEWGVDSEGVKFPLAEEEGTRPFSRPAKEPPVTDTPAPYDPSQPLRADATDKQMHERRRSLYVATGRLGSFGPEEEYVQVTREFASACVVVERAKIERAIRALPCWLPNVADGGRSMVIEKRGGWLHRANVIETLRKRNAP